MRDAISTFPHNPATSPSPRATGYRRASTSMRWLLLLLTAFSSSWAAIAQDSRHVFILDPAEEAIALELLHSDPRWQELTDGSERLVQCGYQLIHDKATPPGEEARRRYALVTEYNYDNGQAVRSLVDLLERQVVQVERAPGAVAGLSADEAQRAEDLALEHPTVAALVEQHGPDQVIFEPMLVRGEVGNPRLVQMAVQLPGGYLIQPLILVNLTEESVLVE